MPTSTTEYRPSINIVRDADASLGYIPTPNGKLVYNQLIEAFGSGRKSFNIIGAYGTGKSAFLWAFEQSITGKQEIFGPLRPELSGVNGFEFIRIVGEHHSVIQLVASKLGLEADFLNSPSEVIDQLDQVYQQIQSKGKGLVFYIDEFGKLLEFASKEDPDGELYFLQVLAEYFNDPTKNAYLITTLHQDFSAYALGLNKRQRLEWDKVKGRYKELVFNEPVEQLLLLAAEHQGNRSQGIKKGYYFRRIFSCIESAKAFPLRDYLSLEIAEKLLPLDILSAGVLTQALQKFGQNQRSLFSFMDSRDHLGLNSFRQTKQLPYFHLGLTFDYLEYNFQSLLNSKYNPEKAKWASIKESLAAVERVGIDQVSEALVLLKAIGLLHIFAPASAQLDHAFWKEYGAHALGIEDVDHLLTQLVKKQIIRYSKFQGRFLPNQGTDLDIEMAIDAAGNIVQRVADPLPNLREYFGTPHLLAKATFFDTGTPRIFAYHLSDAPEFQLSTTDQIDGYVNLIFSEDFSEQDLVATSAKSSTPILFGWYRNTSEIRKLLLEIQKIKKVKEDNPDDRIAIKELDNILDAQVRLLNHYVLGNQYGPDSAVVWCYQGEMFQPKNSKEFNQILSRIMSHAYPHTPIFKNEMVNRTKISTPINTARKQLIRQMLESAESEDFGFDKQRFPPERTIYLTLLKETNMHRDGESGWGLYPPLSPSFQPLWLTSKKFLHSSLHAKRSLNELVDQLKTAPFKIKKGFIDFWLPVFLYIKKDDFALFSEGKYIPYLTSEVFQLIHKDPSKYEVKAFHTEGVHWTLFNQYRSFIQIPGEARPSNRSLIETIRPFLTFYNQLPPYAQHTKRHLSPQAVALRDSIAKAKDPEVLFFETFPRVIGISMEQLKDDPDQMEAYINALKDAIRELRTSYLRFLDRVEGFIAEDIMGTRPEFPHYKELLQKRLVGMNGKFIRQEIKVLYQRINSPLDDRDSWLASIGQAVIGKPLDRFTDAEEQKFFPVLKDKMDELFSLQDLSRVAELEEDEVFKVELLRPGAERETQMVRVKKSDAPKVTELTEKIARILDDADQNTILAVLTRLWEQR